MEKIRSGLYWDATKSVAERVADLIPRMTLAEKLAQMGSVWVFELLRQQQFDEVKAQTVLKEGIGQITRVAGASNLSPQAGAALANTIQRYLLAHTRLGIPALVHEECCSGYMARQATCFPQIIGLASTWEPELAQAMADVVRVQMQAAGARQGLSPVLDVVRDPRWGRVEETFGEDPYLVSQMGVAFVRGLQGQNQRQVIATAKHFVGYGISEGGMNWAPAHIGARTLREVYMLPFEAAVKEANLQSVMNAYHELDGVPCAASRELLTEVLREEWGFDGVVVSDYFAIDEIERSHKLVANGRQAAEIALQAGIDIELPTLNCYGEPLKQAVEAGTLDEALIDQAVARLLRHKFELGLFENPYVDDALTATVFDTPVQRALAREIAQKSMVLLKNEGDLLPLSPTIGSIAVIGPNADSTRHLVGDYAYICHIETLLEMRDKGNVFEMPLPDVDDIDVIDQFVPMNTILQALRERVSPQTVLHHAQGCEVTGEDTSRFEQAVAAAQQAEVAIVVVGGKSGLTDDCTCGEARDRADINLTGVQTDLIKAVQATGTPTVVVLVNGRPLSIQWAAAHVPAILEAWLPGEEGAEAVVDVLFGEANPGGKLPMTFPRDVGQIPTYYNHKPSGGRSYWKGPYVDLSNKPLWPFGFGLSYTRFQLSHLQLDKGELAAGEAVKISLDVTNIGRCAGDEVVQVYIHDPLATVTQPVKALKGFQRLHLSPGETKTVVFTLFANQLGFYDKGMNYVLEPGTIEVMIGTSSEDIHLTDTIEIVGETKEICQDKVFFSQVHIKE